MTFIGWFYRTPLSDIPARLSNGLLPFRFTVSPAHAMTFRQPAVLPGKSHPVRQPAAFDVVSALTFPCADKSSPDNGKIHCRGQIPPINWPKITPARTNPADQLSAVPFLADTNVGSLADSSFITILGRLLRSIATAAHPPRRQPAETPAAVSRYLFNKSHPHRSIQPSLLRSFSASVRSLPLGLSLCCSALRFSLLLFDSPVLMGNLQIWFTIMPTMKYST
jgi:hypothetical protein